MIDNLEQGDFLMAGTSEALKEREHLFVPATLSQCEAFCGDERPSDYDGYYIHVFGGAAFIPYNLEVVHQASGGGVTDETFEDMVGGSVAMQHSAGLKAGVHSDTHAEHSDHIDADQGGEAFGCGYISMRAAISGVIAEQGEELITEVREKLPELFTSPEREAFARKVIAVHAGFAERAGFFTNGRAVGLNALEHGAPGMIVKGNHAAKQGFYNLRDNSTFDNNRADSEALLSYDHDQWAVDQTFDKLRSIYPYDPAEFDIACAIDAFGTMKALDVEEITVRR